MESIAVDIKHNLEGQSKKIERVGSNLGAINNEANMANRQMGEIKKAKAKNRLVLYGVITTLAVAGIVTFIVKLA